MDDSRFDGMSWEDHLAAMIKDLRRQGKERAKDFPTREFRAHTRAANREMLLAVRSLLDKAIENLEEQPPEPKASRIVIE